MKKGIGKMPREAPPMPTDRNYFKRRAERMTKLEAERTKRLAKWEVEMPERQAKWEAEQAAKVQAKPCSE